MEQAPDRLLADLWSYYKTMEENLATRKGLFV